VDRVKLEQSILSSIHNPFLVKLYYSFHTQKNLYLVMEFIPGGDLFSLLETLGPLAESVAKGAILLPSWSRCWTAHRRSW